MATQPATIQAGDRLPSLTLKVLTADGMTDVATDSLFAGTKAVLFGVPGAFTPTCSARHLPGFLQNAEALRAKGIGRIVCMAVNDPFVMRTWGAEQKAGDVVTLLPDGNGALTRALGLELDLSGHGLGVRCQRFAMVVEDGRVVSVVIDPAGAFEKTSAEAVLASL